jgi:DNA-directed RNA polymerase specialized sigma24 family protein
MHQEQMRRADELLIEVLQFEPALRVHLRKRLPVPAIHCAEWVEELLQQIYARIVSTVPGPSLPQAGRSKKALKSFVWEVLREVVQEHLATPHRCDAAPAGAAARVEDRLILGGDAEPDPDVPSASLETAAREDIRGSDEGDDAEMALLVRAVQALPERTRRVFTLHKVYDWQEGQIAAHLRLPLAEVEQHLRFSARTLARDLLGPSEARSPRFSWATFRRRPRWPRAPR